MVELAKKIVGNIEEVLIKDNFIYFPLLFDHEIEKEINNRAIVKHNEKFYIKGIDIHSLVENFDKIDKESYSKIQDRLYKKLFQKDIPHILKNSEYKLLNTLMLDVMPYFVGVGSTFKRKKLEREDIVDFIEKKIDIPKEYKQQASKLLDEAIYKEYIDIIKKLNLDSNITFLEGIIKKEQLENILTKAIEIKIIKEKKKEIEESINLIKENNAKHLALLLYFKNVKHFSIENFGFEKEESKYLVYVKLKEYALQDFDGQIYLFPPCKVGTYVSLTEISNPIVIDKYKHPFLRDYASNQRICIKDFEIKGDTLGEKIISVLEQGISTLLYGYFSTDFEGYRYLNGKDRYGPTLSFDEYKIKEDDPRIKSGEIIITNAPFIKVDKSYYKTEKKVPRTEFWGPI